MNQWPPDSQPAVSMLILPGVLPPLVRPDHLSWSLTSFLLVTSHPTSEQALRITIQDVRGAAVTTPHMTNQAGCIRCSGSAFCCSAVLRGQRAAACNMAPAAERTFESGDLLCVTRRLSPRQKHSKSIATRLHRN